MPGYGYASVSKEKRLKFTKFIKEYLTKRESLISVFVLIDSRLKPQKNDIEFMSWLGEHRIPFSICFTKQDKISDSESRKNLSQYKKEMLNFWESLPQMFLTSAINKKGRSEVLDFIEETNQSL